MPNSICDQEWGRINVVWEGGLKIERQGRKKNGWAASAAQLSSLGIHRDIRPITLLMILLTNSVKWSKQCSSFSNEPTSFFTAKPIDTDTNGNLHEKKFRALSVHLMKSPPSRRWGPKGAVSIISSVSSTLSNYPDRQRRPFNLESN